MKKKPDSAKFRYRHIATLSTFLLAYSYYFIYAGYGLNLADEGNFVNTSLRILDGQIPYLDFRYYPPALNYALALVFKLFGVNILYERLLFAFVIVLGVLLTMKLARDLMGFPFWLLPPLLFLVVPGPWHKSIIPLLLLLCAVSGYAYVKQKGVRRAFYCGVISGAGLYFRYDTPVFMFIAFIALITAANFLTGQSPLKTARDWCREAGSCLAGAALSVLPAIAYFVYLQAKTGFISDQFRRVTSEHGTMGLPFPRLDPALIASDPSVFAVNALFYLPPLILALVLGLLVLRYYRKRALGSGDLMILLLLILGAFSFNQAYVRADYPHLLQSVHIPYILGIYLLWIAYKAANGSGEALTGGLAKAAVLIFTLVICVSYSYLNISRGEFFGGTIGNIRNRTVRLSLEKAQVYVEPESARGIENVVSFVRENTGPNDPILVLPYAPMFYLLADRHNTTYYDAVFPSTFSNSKKQKSFIESIKESGVRLIVFEDMKFTDKEDSRFSVYCKPVYDFIRANYSLVKVIGTHQIYIKSE